MLGIIKVAGTGACMIFTIWSLCDIFTAEATAPVKREQPDATSQQISRTEGNGLYVVEYAGHRFLWDPNGAIILIPEVGK